MIIFFLEKEAENISPREERQNLNITKYEFMKKSVEIFLTYSFGTKKYSCHIYSWQEKLAK